MQSYTTQTLARAYAAKPKMQTARVLYLRSHDNLVYTFATALSVGLKNQQYLNVFPTTMPKHNSKIFLLTLTCATSCAFENFLADSDHVNYPERRGSGVNNYTVITADWGSCRIFSRDEITPSKFSQKKNCSLWSAFAHSRNGENARLKFISADTTELQTASFSFLKTLLGLLFASIAMHTLFSFDHETHLETFPINLKIMFKCPPPPGCHSPNLMMKSTGGTKMRSGQSDTSSAAR